MPTVSVIMPVFNTKAEYLSVSIESILSQSFNDFELLIINDASTKQETLDVLSSVKDQRIKIFNFEHNQERVKARNFGIDNSIGEFIAFIDDDDISYPERLKKEVEYLLAFPKVDCLGSWCDIIGEDQDNYSQYAHLNGTKLIELYLMFKTCYFPMSTVMLRRNKLEQYHLRFRDEYLISEDYDFWLQMVGKLRFDTLEENLGAYRSHFNNTTHQKASLQQSMNFKCRFDTLYRLFKPKLTEQILKNFDKGRINSLEEFSTLENWLVSILKELEVRGYSRCEVRQIFFENIRNLFYHTKGFKAQLSLFRSPLSNYFRLPLWWKLFCLITRGVI